MHQSNAMREAPRPVSDGVVSLDAERRYTYVNRRAADFLHTDAKSLLSEYI